MKKRLLSMALTLVMALSLLPTAALAAEGNVDVGPENLYYALTQRSAAIRMYPTASGYDQYGHGTYGYMDEQGRWALPPVYQQASAFFASGYAHVVTQQGQGYVINTDGELLLSVGDYKVLDVVGGNVLVESAKSHQGVLSLSGKLIVPIRANATVTFHEDGKYIIQKIANGMDGSGNTTTGQAWVYDATGRDLFPDRSYTYAQVLSADRVLLSTGAGSAVGAGGDTEEWAYTESTLADFSGNRYPLPEAFQKRALRVEPFTSNGLALATYWELKSGKSLMQYFVFVDKSGKIAISEQQADFVTGFQPNGSYYRSSADKNSCIRYDANGKNLGTIPASGFHLLAGGSVLYGWNGVCYTPDGKPLSVPADFGQIDQVEDPKDELIYYHDESFRQYGVMDKTGRSIVPLSPGVMRRVGDYIVHTVNDANGLPLPPKYYDAAGTLVATIPPETSNGRQPLVVGGRTVYAPQSALGTTMAPPTNVVTVTAAPSPTKLLVNGKETAVNAYLIDSSNYMKLRDLAALLTGTGKQFEVSYDAAKGAVNILTGKAYTPAGGELTPGDGAAKTATTGTSPLYIDGKGVRLKAYAIGGNNFYKLRDVMQAMDVYVGYENGTVTLDTAKGYVVETPTVGVYGIRTALDTPKNVDVSEGSTAAGAHIITWDKSGDPNQSFLLQKAGGKYRILAAHSGLALSAGSGEKNVQLVQAAVSDDPNQLFTLLRQPSGGYSLVAANGQYVSVSAGNTDNGTPLILWDKTGSKGQEFVLN